MTDVTKRLAAEREALGRVLLQEMDGTSAAMHVLAGSALTSHDPAVVTSFLDDLDALAAPQPVRDLFHGWLSYLIGRPQDGLTVLSGVKTSDNPQIRALARVLAGACHYAKAEYPAAKGEVAAVWAGIAERHAWIQAQAYLLMGLCRLYHDHETSQAIALFVLSEAAFAVVGDSVGQCKALSNHAMAIGLQGHPEATLPLFQQVLAIGRQARRPPGILTYHNWASFLALSGRWEEAETKLSEGLVLAETAGNVRAVLRYLLGRVEMRQCQRKLDAATADIAELQARASEFGAPFTWMTELARVDQAVLTGNVEVATAIWTSVSDQIGFVPGDLSHIPVHFTGARLALAQGDPDRVDVLMDALLVALDPLDSGLYMSHALYYKHAACQYRGDATEAEACRRQALSLASADAWYGLPPVVLPPVSPQVVTPMAAVVTVQAFGPLEVRSPGGHSIIGSTQSLLPRQLLASLVFSPEGLTAAQLLQRLYAGRPEHKKALQTLIHRLRDSLGAALGDSGHGPSIVCTQRRYRLTPGWPLTSDLSVFRQIHDRWLCAVRPAERATVGQQLIEAYQGPLFEDLPDDDWLISARTTLREQWLSAVEWYLRHLVQQGGIDEAMRLIDRVATMDPAVSRTRLRLVVTGA